MKPKFPISLRMSKDLGILGKKTGLFLHRSCPLLMGLFSFRMLSILIALLPFLPACLLWVLVFADLKDE